MTGVSSWGCLDLEASVSRDGLLITGREDSPAVTLPPTMDA